MGGSCHSRQGSCGSRQQEPVYPKVNTNNEKRVNLTAKQAAQGGKIKLKLGDGETLMVTIPKDAKNGQKLKIRDRGSVCPCCNKNGDLLLVLNIT